MISLAAPCSNVCSGVDIWPIITDPAADGHNSSDAAHASLWLSAEVLLRGKYKLLVAQPDPKKMNANAAVNGWKQQNETWLQPTDAQCACGCAYKNRTSFVPCLFDAEGDASEEHDLGSQQPDVLQQMWAELNRTNLELYGVGHSPSALLGSCNAACAKKHYGGSAGPACGVPGC